MVRKTSRMWMMYSTRKMIPPVFSNVAPVSLLDWLEDEIWVPPAMERINGTMQMIWRRRIARERIDLGDMISFLCTC